MAYVKQNFVDGNVLYASELNHIEDGIADAYVKPASGIPTADIANDAVATAKIPNTAVTREKLANDALYSPVVGVSSRALTVADIGKTLHNSWEVDTTLTLTKTNSSEMPIGTEIAIYKWGATAGDITITTSGGIRLAIYGQDATRDNGSFVIKDTFGMIALKKINGTASLDTWLVTGNVEVVS